MHPLQVEARPAQPAWQEAVPSFAARASKPQAAGVGGGAGGARRQPGAGPKPIATRLDAALAVHSARNGAPRRPMRREHGSWGLKGCSAGPPAPASSTMVAHAQVIETSEEEAYCAVAKHLAELKDGAQVGPPGVHGWRCALHAPIRPAPTPSAAFAAGLRLCRGVRAAVRGGAA